MAWLLLLLLLHFVMPLHYLLLLPVHPLVLLTMLRRLQLRRQRRQLLLRLQLLRLCQLLQLRLWQHSRQLLLRLLLRGQSRQLLPRLLLWRHPTLHARSSRRSAVGTGGGCRCGNASAGSTGARRWHDRQ